MRAAVISAVIAMALVLSNEILSLALLTVGAGYGLYKLFEAIGENKI